jgi:molybdopterin molybdotransferase
MAGVLSAMRWRPGARWLVLACDLAMITPDAVAWLLAQARPGLDAVMPVLPGRPTCEPLFAVYEPTARWFVELAAARGEFSLRRALQLGRVLQPQPPCDMQTAWTNVNTREEWRRIERPSSTRGNKLKDAQSMISLERALEVVLRAAPRLPSTEVRLEVAAGRVLAENVVSDVDLPPFKKSAMDGFAVRSEDIADVPAELRVVEDVPAGSVPRRATHSGECARIMTGAPVPEGADTVVMVEHTEPAGPGRVRILRAAPKGRNICLRGEDVKTGQTVLAEGTRLRPFQVALAAAVGRRSLRVSATPSVAVLATGDEVIEPDQTPRPGQIRNSNSYALAARLGQEGIWVDYLGIAVDDIAVLQAAFEKGMQRDVFVVSGGVSTGDYDLVPGALKDAGVELLFSEIAVQPGRPTVFGRRGRTMVFGLPGNPVSTLVIAELLLVPALRRMMGESNPSPLMIRAVLDGPLPHGGNRTSFRPVALRRSAEGWHAEPVVYHGSADLVGAARADAFAVVPADALELPAGSTVLALVFPLSLE